MKLLNAILRLEYAEEFESLASISLVYEEVKKLQTATLQVCHENLDKETLSFTPSTFDARTGLLCKLMRRDHWIVVRTTHEPRLKMLGCTVTVLAGCCVWFVAARILNGVFDAAPMLMAIIAILGHFYLVGEIRDWHYMCSRILSEAIRKVEEAGKQAK